MSTKHCAYCEAVDDTVIKALGTMIWVSMPESVKEICYGCRGVTDEEGRPKLYFTLFYAKLFIVLSFM